MLIAILSIAVFGLILLSGYLWTSREKALRLLAVEQKETELLRSQQATREQMNETFKGLAATALESSMGQLLTLAQSTFKPMNEALAQYQQQLSLLEKDRVRSFQMLDSELKKVIEGQVLLARETGALKDALKKPHVRGRWGEVQLRNCIELAGMSEHADVVFQDFQSDEEGGRHIPDMIVRMPGGRCVVVDAKTPIDAFLNSLEAVSEEERRAEMLRHGKHVKEHVKKLSTRAYSQVIKESADFTVLFLPNESFLYAALEAEPDIVEFALQKKVLIATPPTLIGLLKVIRYGWSEQRMAENAQRISELGQELHKRLCDFVDTYIAVGKHIDKAKEEFDKGRARLESRVLVQARRFEALGAKSNRSLIEPPPEGS